MPIKNNQGSDNIPLLRFPEFNGEWEKKKLGEVLTIGSGRDYKHLGEGEIPVFGTGGLMTKVDDYLYDGETVCIGRKGTIDKPMYFNGKIWTVDTLFYTHSFINSTPKFVYNLFQRVNWKQYNEAGGVPSLSKSTIEQIELVLPSLPEQTKIASFLTAVDEKIQVLKKKHSRLEQYKKGVMQKLFSQETEERGSRTPLKNNKKGEQLRFKDENGNDFPEWEVKKLGEVCGIIGGGTPETNKEEYWNGEINWFTPTEIKTNYVTKSLRRITQLGLKKSSAKILPVGTILLTTRATIGDIAIALEECTTNQGFQSLVVKNRYNNIFIFNWIKENKHELTSRANGSTFPEISKSEIEKIEIPIPCLEEQTRIANFLSAIDEKINQTQMQIEKMEVWKKGLLQKMFC